MKTSDLERELGLSKHTIRYYEKEGFITPQRDDNGYRNYSDEDLQILKLVKFLRGLNISIDDVKAIINGQLDFHECLRINQIHLENQIESMKEVKQTIDNYHDKDLPLIPALENIEVNTKNWKWGYHKTTKAVSLGRKLTKAWAKRQMLVASLSSIALSAALVMWLSLVISSRWISIIIFLCLTSVLFILMIATAFRQTFAMMLDNSLDQSVEFLSEGIRYYQFKGLKENLKYFWAVLMNKDKKIMKFYRYEDISKVCIYAKLRYMNVGSPIAYEVYAADFEFYFNDGQKFYFYYPMILDDDARYIAAILEAKVSCIKDKDNVLYAMKNGLNLTDYMLHKD